jgi:molybdopterin synthase sulfur carrier subunit
MELELRFFATFREAVGQKTLREEYDSEAITVGELARQLETEYPDIELFEEDDTLRGFITVMKNGREITYMDGLDTELEDGDTLSVFPPVAGGGSGSRCHPTLNQQQ